MNIYFIIPLALVPDPVEDLKAHVDSSVPSVALCWTPPQNVGARTPSSCSDVSCYQIRIKSSRRQHSNSDKCCGLYWERNGVFSKHFGIISYTKKQNYYEISVGGSTTSIVLDRETGLTPHSTFTFEVRAQCGEDVGQWRAVQVFVGELKQAF